MWRSSSAIAVYEGEFLRACLPGRISEKTDPLLLRGRPISTRIPVAKGGNLVSLVRARGFSRDLRGKRANAVGGWQIPDKGLTKKKKTSKKQQKKNNCCRRDAFISLLSAPNSPKDFRVLTKSPSARASRIENPRWRPAQPNGTHPSLCPFPLPPDTACGRLFPNPHASTRHGDLLNDAMSALRPSKAGKSRRPALNPWQNQIKASWRPSLSPGFETSDASISSPKARIDFTPWKGRESLTHTTGSGEIAPKQLTK